MKFKKTTLPNGLRVVTVPTEGNPAVTVMILVESGSNYETKEQSGLSHFLEHMVFKGTKRRPNTLDISREMDELGAEHNAFTANEFTGFWAKGESRHFKKLLDILADMYLNPTLSEEEMEKERGVIIQEILMYEDMPQHKVGRLFLELMYGDAPAGRFITGPAENVKKFTRKDLEDYRAGHYVADNTIVVVAGDIEDSEVKTEVMKTLGEIERKRKPVKPAVKEEQKAPALLVHKKKTDQTHMILGFHAFNALDKRMPALQVLASILGRGMSSRLFHKLRNEMGACYYVSASADDYSDYGYFGIATGVESQRIEEVTKVILAECIKLMREAVPPEELQKAKEYLSGRLYLGLETTDSLAEFYGVQEAIKHMIEKPEEVERDIRAVSAEDVQNVAREIFRAEKLNLAVVGDIEDEARLEKLLVI
ncbi:insulinase family protein [Candidatus Parcubacteria bacterium]|nr:insulinase family protein [Candidatus Parcubacteria bacterium]